jgi:hypothetical protein
VSRPFTLEEAIYRELDQMREASERQAAAFERAVGRLEARDEERDQEVSELKLKVAGLMAQAQAPAARDWKRDAGLVVAPSTIVAILTAVAQHFAQPTPPAPPRPPMVQVQP